MSATVSTLLRHDDPSGVSGTGPVGTVVEFGSGLTAFHWDTDTPSVTVYTDVRHVLQLHGHGGASTLHLNDNDRLVRAYQKVVPWLLTSMYENQPTTCGEHPDHPGRLRLTFANDRTWRFWVALFDGSTDAATHVEVNGETRHRWIDSAGDLWLEWFEPLLGDDPLAIFHREDR